MKRLTLMVSGNVQKAGYRDIIIRLGMALGLRGYAENLPDGRVKVVAEGDEKKLELLKESADIKNTLIEVEKIESGFSEATGEFSGFFKLVREGETDERLDRAAELLKELIGAVQSGFNETVTAIKSVKADTSAMLEKQDSMLEKQDSLIKITEKGFADMKIGFMEVKEEIHSVRDDFREMFMHEVSELRGEIAEIKATLARMQAAG
ncbi:MAG: acylphosphatase [Candidatus Methanoperedens sp.]|nr:acylphosphatase [Candidatus Methanoperedens sp.]